jgi:hypothetical protein
MIVNGKRYEGMGWMEYEAKLDDLGVQIKAITQLFKDGKGDIFQGYQLLGLIEAMRIFDIRDREPCLDRLMDEAVAIISRSVGDQAKLTKLLRIVFGKGYMPGD